VTDQNVADVSFEQLISGLHRLSHSLACESDSLLQQKFGLGTTQFKIAWVLKKHPSGVPQKSIASWLQQTEAAISRQMKGMQAEGLIKNYIDPENRRQHVICLTPKGAAFAEKSMQCMKQQQGDVFDVLTGKERTALCGMLEKVFQALVKKNKWS